MTRLLTASAGPGEPPKVPAAPEPGTPLPRAAQQPEAADLDRVLIVAHPHATAVLPPEIAGAIADRTVARTASVTAAFRATSRPAARPHLVVVHLEGVDRFSDGWAGHRLVERLMRATGTEVVAWLAADDLDGRALARALGARVVTGPARGGLRRGDEPLGAWFRRRHHARWEEWHVEACVALASAADRGTQAEYCRQAWGFQDAAAAQRRLRYLRALLGEEMRDHPGHERRLAIEILRAVSTSRPIPLAPLTVRSVHVAARALRTHPELDATIGLTESEAGDVLAVADTEVSIGAAVTNSSGRPPAGTWLLRRQQAIGRVASARTDDRLGAEAERKRIESHLERSLLAIHDALEDGAG